MDGGAGRFWSARARRFDSTYEFANLWDRLVHQPLRIRHDATMAAIRALPAPSVCDIGCGSGRQLEAALAAGASRCVGIDLSEEMVALARRRLEAAGAGGRAEVVIGDALGWEPGDRFDLVYALGVFDYEADPRRLLAKLAELSRKQVLATFRRAWALRSPFRKLSYQLRGRPIYLHTAAGIRQAMERVGLRNISVDRLTAGLYIARAETAVGGG
jgi:SAM-dependent methyltransferase